MFNLTENMSVLYIDLYVTAKILTDMITILHYIKTHDELTSIFHNNLDQYELSIPYVALYVGRTSCVR